MPIVSGLDKFRDAMRGHEEKFVLIGGGACSLLFSELGADDFRSTKDLDLVILVDGKDAGFMRSFWSFVEAGGYDCGSRSDTGARYYRFDISEEESIRTGYPKQIELFARHPEFDLAPGAYRTPLPVEDDDVRSLSAIILDDGYYEFLKKGLVSIEGVLVPDVLHIIPLKMRAHIDNNDLYARGVSVQEKDRTKHRGDVVRLSGLLPRNARLPLEGQLLDDARRFFNDLAAFAERPELDKKSKRRAVKALDFLKGVYI